MGTRWGNPRGKDLYAWWADRIADELLRRAGRRVAGAPAPVIVNLASQEYAKAALRPALVRQARVVHCVFEDWKDSAYQVISFHAKRARGLMARHVITHRLGDPQALQGFDLGGYRFEASASEPDRLVFRRRTAA
jgi:cytoplasmic iron level regulating protein YaaA (DUF328/UPF0246 family)